MKTFIIVAISLVFTLLLFSHFTMSYKLDKTETAGYEVIEKYEHFEIRRYPEMIIASTKLSKASYSKVVKSGFKTIAGYIFGDNGTKSKIAMTSPVMTSISDTLVMSFMMPSSYKFQELPLPNDKSVHLSETNSKLVAAISFGGWADDDDIEHYSTLLKSHLDEENIAYTKSVSFFGYNPPFQLTNRKNEVIIELISNE